MPARFRLIHLSRAILSQTFQTSRRAVTISWSIPDKAPVFGLFEGKLAVFRRRMACIAG
jgi:hypothetical protein